MIFRSLKNMFVVAPFIAPAATTTQARTDDSPTHPYQPTEVGLVCLLLRMDLPGTTCPQHEMHLFH